MKHLALYTLLLGACGVASEEPTAAIETTAVEVETTEPGAPAPMAMAIDTLGFTSEGPSGVAPGFDLDGKVSASGEADSCGNGDFTSPDGRPGIDNQLAVLTPLFDLVGLGAIEDLVQRAIEEGGLLIMYELRGVDDLENDPDVQLSMKIGNGVPLLGTDGLLLSGQTFHESDEYAATPLSNAKIEDGVLTAGPFDTALPITVFGVNYALSVNDGYLRAELTYDGGMVEGLLGGAVPMEDLWDIAAIANEEAGGIMDAVTLILQGIPDMLPDADGNCQAMSGTFEFTAVSAFLSDE